LRVKIFCVVASGCFEFFGVVSHGGKAAKVDCCREARRRGSSGGAVFARFVANSVIEPLAARTLQG
jgi:hypothetical protein